MTVRDALEAAVPASGEERMHWSRHIPISAFWLANNLHWGVLTMFVVPSQSSRLAHSIGITEAEIGGWTIGMGALVGAAVPPIVGLLSDRCTAPMGRRRPYVIAGTILNILALFCFYWGFQSRSLLAYIATWMLIGLGNNIAVGAYSGIIPDVVAPADRGMASAWMATMQQLGTIGGFILGGFFFAAGREQDLLALTTLSVVVTMVTMVTVLGIREPRLVSAPAMDWRELRACFWVDPVQHRDFAWVWITRAFFTAGFWLIQTVLLWFMRDVVRHGDPSATLGILGGVVVMAAIPTGLVGGILSDRVGRKPIICLVGVEMALTAAGFAFLGLLPEPARFPVVLGLGVLWGCGYGAYLSVDWALATDVLPNPEDAGKDMGVWHLSMVLPQTLAAPAAGLILRPFVMSAGQGYTVSGYAVLFLSAAVCMFLCGILILPVKKVR